MSNVLVNFARVLFTRAGLLVKQLVSNEAQHITEQDAIYLVSTPQPDWWSDEHHYYMNLLAHVEKCAYCRNLYNSADEANRRAMGILF